MRRLPVKLNTRRPVRPNTTSRASAASTHVDLQAAPLPLVALRQMEQQHPVLVVGRDGAAVYGVGQGEGAHEAPLRPLGAPRVQTFDGRAVAADDEATVVERNVEPPAVDAGQV